MPTPDHEPIWATMSGLTGPQRQFLREHWVFDDISEITAIAGVPGEQAFATVHHENGKWEWGVYRSSGLVFEEGYEDEEAAAKASATNSLALLL